MKPSQLRAQAVADAEAAAPFVTRNKEEYERIVNDMRAIALLMQFYNAKTKAAEQVLRYGYDHDAAHLEKADALLAESVDRFRELTNFAGPAYRTATAMETSQRRIPFPGGMDRYPNWQQCLPMYEKELATFRKRRAQWLTGGARKPEQAKPLPQVAFTLEPGAGEKFTVTQGAQLFTGSGATIADLAPELEGMEGIRIAPRQGGTLRFSLSAPAQILVGFAAGSSKNSSVLDPETEQWNLLLLNAVSGKGIPAMAAWAKPLAAGANELDLGKGQYVILGFIPAAEQVTPHVNLAGGDGGTANLDWLFE